VAMLVVNRMEGDADADICIDPGFAYKSAKLITLNGGTYANKHMVREETEISDLSAVRFPAASVSILLIK